MYVNKGRMTAVVRDVIKAAALLLACWILGATLLYAAYLLPTDRARENAREYAGLYQTDWEYPYPYEVAGLGPVTDYFMVSIASYDGKAGPLVESMEANRFFLGGLAESVFAEESSGERMAVVEYPRYWHGYLVFLKPLLQFFNLWDIRMLNTIAQMGLIAAVIALLVVKKRMWLIIPYVVSLYFIWPPATFYCLAFSPIVYIYHIGMIWLLWRGDRVEACGRLPMFFMLLGVATSYFDFLTYPIATLGIPAAVWLSLQQGEKPVKHMLKIARWSVCWGFGYGGMWVGKWLIASAVLRRSLGSLLGGAFAGYVPEVYIGYSGQPITVLDTLVVNLGKYTDAAFLALYAGLLILALVLWLRNRSYLCYRSGILEALPYLLIFLMAPVWLALGGAHPYIHCGFTCRTWCVSAFAGTAAIACLLRRRLAELPKTSTNAP